MQLQAEEITEIVRRYRKFKRRKPIKPLHEPTHAEYLEAKVEAKKRADASGCDVGIELNEVFGTYRVFGLPMKQHRTGCELRCEVVHCTDLSKCQKGHGP